ncbi:MAG: hypothetical protein BWX70_03545 [Verrucomicrobia bacterium ADurb.Bin070]|nr:MAG: hypothetical protein BWX70_03545 [Verrucomicrobia bacterium ADurb.Bin070]
MLTPARMPVTAGKKTASTGQKPSAAGGAAEGVRAAASGVPPRNSEASESTMKAITTNCVRSARSAEKAVITPRIASVIRPTVLTSNIGSTATTDSAKPAA